MDGWINGIFSRFKTKKKGGGRGLEVQNGLPDLGVLTK